MFRFIFFISFCIFSCLVSAQHRVEGTVTNQKGERLFQAIVFSSDNSLAQTADESGRFILDNVPKGWFRYKCSYLGYQTLEDSVFVDGPKKLNIVLRGTLYNLDNIEIVANKLGAKSPFTFQNIKGEDLRKENVGQDVPFLLQFTPSAVVTSDAGTGIGYTGIRIRGTDQNRINVTINGVPLNDAESQGVFWVDLPDIINSTEEVQIQRGVGSSTNGPGAFGASILLNTQSTNVTPSIMVSSQAGSFGHSRLSVNVNSGLMNNKYLIEGRYSTINSDGYIDRGSARLRSYYFSAARLTEKSSLRFITFSGTERTYQAWNGVPEAKVNGDQDALLQHYFNNVGQLYFTPQDSINLFQSGRNYNYYTYENQVDDYTQSHYQLHYARNLSSSWILKSTLYYTSGRGFFEEQKFNQRFSAYQLPNYIDELGQEIRRAEIIRRRWLDNDLIGANLLAQYSPRVGETLTFGGNVQYYLGDHFGNVLRAMPDPGIRPTDRYYDNQGEKQEASGFVKWEKSMGSKWNFFADAQLRAISYQVQGLDRTLRPLDIDTTYLFFNPKVGVFYQLSGRENLYASFAVANREPDRSDFIDNLRAGVPRSERLHNLEIGYQYRGRKSAWQANVYFMDYTNQLILTGELNDSGNPIRVNTPDSYRLGLELAGEFQLKDWLTYSPMVTFSRNKVRAFDEVLFDYTNGEERVVIPHQNTDISYAPSVVAGQTIGVRPARGLLVQLVSRYVSSQYLDNTQNTARSLPAYHFHNVLINYQLPQTWIKDASFQLAINNVFNQLYSTNGYSYSYIFDQTITENFLYPQAGRHFFIGINLKF